MLNHRFKSKLLAPAFAVLLGLFAFQSAVTANANVRCGSLFQDAVALHLKADEVAIFGYGSLLNIQSVERTLGRPYTQAIRSVRLVNWSRQWDIVMPNLHYFSLKTPEGDFFPKNILYLNVRPQEGKSVNGIVIIIKKTELEKMNVREFIYDAVDITNQLPGLQVEGGKIYVYQGKPEFIVPEGSGLPHVGLRESYLRMVEHGMSGHPEDFQMEFAPTTLRGAPKNAIFKDVAHPKP
ncbi:MAG: gamma-glutamylcyclotransferase [Bdellovibrionaceae bacterium]|nr:gamma-glutamylcyclotransferase [Pseudobdellovibrionaceae bacterium]